MNTKQPEQKSPGSDDLGKKIQRLERILCRGQSWHSTLIESISSPIFYKNRQGIYLGCNRAFGMFIGKPISDIIGKTVHDIAPRELAKAYEAKDKELFETLGKQRYEFRVKTAGGIYKDVIFDKTILYDPAGKPTGIVGVISDITEQKNSEKTIQALSQMLIQSQERERYMISCELHDTIAQNLSTLKLNCSRMFGTKNDLRPDIRSNLEDANRLIDQMIQSIRNLAHNLRPSGIDLLGLSHAVETFCEEFSKKNGLQVEVQIAGMDGLDLSEGVEINLYRIVQEGLNNIKKHARATAAIVRLISAYPHIILQIEDNGRGFNIEKVKQESIKKKRMGLWSMKTRVNHLQGLMAIDSRLNEGTKISVKLKTKASLK